MREDEKMARREFLKGISATATIRQQSRGLQVGQQSFTWLVPNDG